MCMRGSDNIRIAVNEAFYAHLSNKRGLYTNESTAGVSLRISRCTMVASLVSGRVKIRSRNAGRDFTALWQNLDVS